MNKTRTGILLLILSILFLSGCRPATQTDFSDYESKETEETEEILEYAGNCYIPKKNIETYLFMGIYDVLFVVVRDVSAGTLQTLKIDYAHIGEDGLTASCETVKDAVSSLLGGQKIDGYAAVPMEKIQNIDVDHITEDPLKLYEELEEYLVTDIPLKTFGQLARLAAGAQSIEALQLEEENLQEIITTLFYQPYE